MTDHGSTPTVPMEADSFIGTEAQPFEAPSAEPTLIGGFNVWAGTPTLEELIEDWHAAVWGNA